MVAGTKIEKILVPLDGSKNSFRGLDYAILLAKPVGATIVAVHALPTPPIFSKKPINVISAKYLADAEVFMNLANQRAKKSGVKFRHKITEWENPGAYIVNLAKIKKFDIIVIGARGRGSAKEFFLGSTSHYVVHKSKIPVLVVK